MLATWLLASVLLLPAAARAQTRSFDLPAGELVIVLADFGRQAGIQIVAPADAIVGVRTPAVRGRLQTMAVLQRLLRGTSLEIARNDGNRITLRRRREARPPASLARNTVRSLPAQIATPQAYTPPEPVNIVVIGEMSQPAFGAERPPGMVINSFARELIASEPSADMNELLRNLSPSFNVASFPISDGSSFIRPPTIRGLPADAFVVTVNGHRRHRGALVQVSGGYLVAGSQGVDLNQIPAIALERIEFLSDATRTLSGADAAAGTLDFTLRRDTGLELQAQYGQYYAGDGAALQLAANGGIAVGDGGFVNLSAEFSDSKSTHRGAQRPSAHLTLQQYPELSPFIGDPVQRKGSPFAQALRTVGNAELPVGAGTLYAFGNYSTLEQRRNSYWRQGIAITGPDAQGNGDATLYPSATAIYTTIWLDRLANGNYDFEGRTFNFSERHPYGFLPVLQATITDRSLIAGYRTDLGAFDVDASVGRGSSRIRYDYENTVNPSMGPLSPDRFALGASEQVETNATLLLTRALPDSGLSLTGGIDLRYETYAMMPGDEPSWLPGEWAVQQVIEDDAGTTFVNSGLPIGANGFPGFSEADSFRAGQTKISAFARIATDLARGLRVGAAARLETASGFSPTAVWSIDGEYRPHPEVMVYATAGSGYHVPTTGQLYTRTIATSNLASNVDAINTLPANDPATAYFGGEPIRAEHAFSLSGGTRLQPLAGLGLSFDLYMTAIDDRIGMSERFAISGDQQRNDLRDLGVVNFATVNSIRFLTNGFSTRTAGFDIAADYQRATVFGLVSLKAAINHNRTEVTRFDDHLVGALRAANVEDMVPHWRANLWARLETGPFDLSARAQFYDSFISHLAPEAGGSLRFGSEWVFDLEARLRLDAALALVAGVDNLFNNYPDRDRRATGTPQQNWYEFTGGTLNGSIYFDHSPFGFNGGLWYVRLEARY